MSVATGFSNSFAAGEISDEAWDRVDLQQVAKGCRLAQNYLIRIPGPLGKRRGFFRLGPVADQAKRSRLVPFRRSIDDALMLEFADLVVRVWQPNGVLLTSFASPYAEADLEGLRYKQIADVIELRHRDHVLAPRSLTRTDNLTWAFALKTFPNGPWLPENPDDTLTLSFTLASGTEKIDIPTGAKAGSILDLSTVQVTASAALWKPEHVGAFFRVRAGDGNPGIESWAPGKTYSANQFVLSNSRIYLLATGLGTGSGSGSTPPLHTAGTFSDGKIFWTYIHDGAGVMKIDAVVSDTVAFATAVTNLPVTHFDVTRYFAEGAYSDLRGWPGAWPALREERLADASTAHNPDFVDLTATAGFTPTREDFTPGTGTGTVVATDAVRRRLGDDGSPVLWMETITYLVAGTESGEFIIAGSVLDEPISPSGVVVKQPYTFGSADVKPVRVHDGLVYVTRGGEDLREFSTDTQQNAATRDMSWYARHLADRGFAQLAWLPQPDNVLWLRLGDGGVATYVLHKEQQVMGFCSQALPPGWICEDLMTLPGPGRKETLWMIASRVKAGATQRVLLQQSQAADGLFMDVAEAYAGAPTSTLTGLDHFEGESVRILANGVQSDAVVSGGAVPVAPGTTAALVGQAMACEFLSLKIDTGAAVQTLNLRQRPTGAIVSAKSALCYVGQDGGRLEQQSARTTADAPGTQARRFIKNTTFAGDTTRDPAIRLTDDTAYDGLIYSLRPLVNVNG